MASPFIDRLGWSLIHFLWEGALVALLLSLALLPTKCTSSNLRYGIAFAALIMLALCPVATFFGLSQPQSAPSAPRGQVTVAISTSFTPSALSSSNVAPRPVSQRSSAIQKFLPELVLLWAIGVAVLTVRLTGGFFHVELLKRKYATAASPEWQARLDRLAKAMGISHKVQLLESSRVQVPAALGLLRAFVILPCSLATKLSPGEIDSLLMHELAHIRRHDYVFNLFQLVIETVLFYHPAVWFVSRIVRAEREHCCDDIAATASVSPVVYARALAALEETRGTIPSLSLSAKGGSLMNRITRVLGIPGPIARSVPIWPSAALLAGLVVLLGLVIGGYAEANPPSPKPNYEKRKRAVLELAKHRPGSAQTKPAMPALPHKLPGVAPEGSLKVRDIKERWTYGKSALTKNGLVPANESKGKFAVVVRTAAGSKVVLKSRPMVNSPARKRSPSVQPKPVTPLARKGFVTADMASLGFAEAVRTIANQVGASFVIAPDSFPVVNLKLINMPGADAVDAVCFAAGAVVRHHGDVLYFTKRQSDADLVNDRVTVHLKNVDLIKAAKEVGRLMGVRIDVMYPLPTFETSLDLDQANIDEAITALCDQFGMKCIQEGHANSGMWTLASKG